MRCGASRWFLAALLTSVMGCASSSPPVTYYRLTASLPPPATQGANAALADSLIGIGPIRVPDVVQLSRPTAEGLQVDEFHRWAGNLEREMGRALVLQLSRQLDSEQIVTYPWSVPFTPEYQVVVDVLLFAIDDGGRANLEARWSVLGKEDREPRLRASAISRAVGSPTAGGRADALRQTVADLGQEIGTELLRLAEAGQNR